MTITHDGDSGTYCYFDFLEIAIVATTLRTETSELKFTAATDWDTEHSQVLAPERTAWMIYSLGFQARVNHYVGALWFYEINNVGQEYASATITFSGAPDPNLTTQIILGTVGQPSSTDTTIEHLNLIGDTTETLATGFALLLNGGYTAVWAQSQRQPAHDLLACHGHGRKFDYHRDQCEHYRPNDHALGRRDYRRSYYFLGRSGW